MIEILFNSKWWYAITRFKDSQEILGEKKQHDISFTYSDSV